MKQLSRIMQWPFMVAAACTALVSCSGSVTGPSEYLFYVGSSSHDLNHPIYLCRLDPAAPAFTMIDSFGAVGGAGYLDLNPAGNTLYATSGRGIKGHESQAAVAAFRVDPDSHALGYLGAQSSQGRGNCHVQTSPDGRFVFAANYSSGHVAALPVDNEGRLREATSVVRGEGSGPVKSRQEAPHAHQVMTDPGGRFLLVPDLGTDKVMIYALDNESGTLVPNEKQPFLRMPAGSGPRHLAFHPSGDLVFVLGELDATLTSCAFDAETGVLEIIDSEGIVEEPFQGNRQSAAVRVHPNGKYVYASNRSDVSNLTVFRISDEGTISRIQVVEDVPYWPRDFNLTPDGRHLIVAGARANRIQLYQVDGGTGLLSETCAVLEVPSPTSLVFVE